MTWALGVLLLGFLLTVSVGFCSLFTEHGLSLGSYNLCSHKVTRNVTRSVAYEEPYKVSVPCGGWFVWKNCLVDAYKVVYKTIEVPETRNITNCCEGYEQVGMYCVSALNQTNNSLVRPGMCPSRISFNWNQSCVWDDDCPSHMKCCNTSRGQICTITSLEGSNNYWYNITVWLKVDFVELQRVDLKLQNHTRILHSVVSGALLPWSSSVFHIHSAKAGPYEMVSCLIVKLYNFSTLGDVYSEMEDALERIDEIYRIEVKDIDECLYSELNDCSQWAQCTNTEVSYDCKCLPDFIDMGPERPGRICRGDTRITSLMILNVTSTSFDVIWTTNGTGNHHVFLAQLFEGQKLSLYKEIHEMRLEVTGLNPGVFYTVKISCAASNHMNDTAEQTIRTPASIINGQFKITNFNFSNELANFSSPAYKSFTDMWLTEFKNSLSEEMKKLYRDGYITVKITSLSPGSIVVTFQITICGDNSTEYINSTMTAVIQSQTNSSTFQYDPKGTLIEVVDLCRNALENDCSPYAECISQPGSYTCKCLTGYTDGNLFLPGRICKAESSISAYQSTSTTPRKMERGLTEAPTISIIPTEHHSTPHTTVVLTEILTSSSSSSISPPVTVLTSPCGNATMGSEISSPSTTSSASVENTAGVSDSIISTDIFKYESLHSTATTQIYSTTTATPPPPPPPTTTTTTTTTATTTTPSITTPTTATSTMTTSTTTPSITTPTTATSTMTTSTTTSHITTPTATTTSSSSTTTTTVTTTASLKTLTTSMASDTWPNKGVISIASGTTVHCSAEVIEVIINKTILQEFNIPESALFLGLPECNVSKSNSSHIFLYAGWNECKTLVTYTTDTTIVKTSIQSSSSLSAKNVKNNIVCTFPNSFTISSGYENLGTVEEMQAFGSYEAEVQLFSGNNPITRNNTLNVDDDVLIRVAVGTKNAQMKTVVSTCWATVTESPMGLPMFPFINNSCSLPYSFTEVIENGNSSVAQFKLKVFSLVNESVAYLHCKVNICMEKEGTTCKPTCSGERGILKSGDTIFKKSATWGPIFRCRPNGDSKSGSMAKHGLAGGFIALIVIACVVIVATVAGILALRHKQKTGKYSFTIKKKFFGYEVFDS